MCHTRNVVGHNSGSVSALRLAECLTLNQGTNWTWGSFCDSVVWHHCCSQLHHRVKWMDGWIDGRNMEDFSDDKHLL